LLIGVGFFRFVTLALGNQKMIQLDLYRSISRATGDSVATIKRLGFLIADPSQPISDPEAECFGPHVLDWDELDWDELDYAEPTSDEDQSLGFTCA